MRRGILEGEEVADFIRLSPRWARNYAATWMIVHGAELRRISEEGEVSSFVRWRAREMRKYAEEARFV